MSFSQAFLLALLLELALLETGAPQRECQSRVVVTSPTELREELANAMNSFSGFRNATIANIPTRQLNEQINTRIENKLDAMNQSRYETANQMIEKLNAVNQTLHNKIDAVNQSLEDRFGAISQQLHSMERLRRLGLTSSNAARSCSEIKETNPAYSSGYYWVNVSTGRPHKVYCDMTRSCGGVTGGWMRVAYLDMTNSHQRCPSGFRQRTNSNFRTCALYSESGGCSSVQYTSQGIQYSTVCGKIKAYLDKTPDGFETHTSRRGHSINSNYVDGVSLTYGAPSRQHIWTFAATRDCPCPQVPTFVGNDYFCDGRRYTSAIDLQNPLWDGENCATTCCRRNNPPWFYKQLPRPTTNDIEMRVCRDQEREDEDVAIEGVEIYVQ